MGEPDPRNGAAVKAPPAVNLPSRTWSLSSEHANGLVDALAERADELTDRLIKAIAGTPKLSDLAWVPAAVGPSTDCVRSVVMAVGDPNAFDPQSAMESGADQARARVAVPSVIEGDHIGFRRLWQIFVDEAAHHPAVDAQTLHQMTVNLYAVEDVFETAKFSGYRDQQRRQALEEMSQRSVMLDSLLHGHNHDAWTLWEIANYLRLPTEGPFVVIVGEVGGVGCEALPEIESKLRSLDVFSAWRLLPDLHVGIAHIASEHHLDRVIALLTRMAAHRVGVSARFDHLRDTPLGLHFAKVSLRGQATAAAKVAVFDGSMLTTAAVSAPTAMVKSATVTLGGLNDLPDDEREILVETFQAWLDNDASVRATAEVLFVHFNTVRKRLRRIEQHTGRSLSRPRDLIELGLALEVHRRLM
jgi:PucR-like helix-turn-helix protein/diguanylate cyclase with GGDEF domain